MNFSLAYREGIFWSVTSSQLCRHWAELVHVDGASRKDTKVHVQWATKCACKSKDINHLNFCVEFVISI